MSSIVLLSFAAFSCYLKPNFVVLINNRKIDIGLACKNSKEVAKGLVFKTIKKVDTGAVCKGVRKR